MDIAVSDSDVLIHLAKLNQLILLNKQFTRIFVSGFVYNETIVQGIKLQKQDANILKEFIQADLILVKKVEQVKIIDIMKKHSIHKGESSILALAKEYNINYCLSNEIKVRNIFKSEGFKVVGTLGIILKAFNIGNINKDKCIELLNNIQANSKEFRFHPKLINKVIEEVNNRDR